MKNTEFKQIDVFNHRRRIQVTIDIYMLLCRMITAELIRVLMTLTHSSTWCVLQKLLRGTHSWSLAELVHAIVLMGHFHALSSFVHGCSMVPESPETSPIVNGVHLCCSAFMCDKDNKMAADDEEELVEKVSVLDIDTTSTFCCDLGTTALCFDLDTTTPSVLCCDFDTVPCCCLSLWP